MKTENAGHSKILHAQGASSQQVIDPIHSKTNENLQLTIWNKSVQENEEGNTLGNITGESPCLDKISH